ncbi:hypothetical protein M407DRAFT_21871 [Tulasnella calospora MUT 4182]|uniref:Uncharacterized protein n=1 Tax=Tulasnella calospora MUT 4182 TaxID=1051891 RepID=A0A0C3QDE0_9AGAM|nr:hypothetical protein M407DRAFT_21871 [Tulasnella calospora MUT 4182]
MDHEATNYILSNIRIPNRHRVLIRAGIIDVNAGSVLFTPAITHILRTTIPTTDLSSSIITVEVDEEVDCMIQFRGMELRLFVEGEEQVHEILGWLADGLGPEAAECPVHLTLDWSELDPVRLVAVPPPLVVKHLSISDFLSGSLSESLCSAMVQPPDPKSFGWFLAQMESLRVGFETIESQGRLISILRSRYEEASSRGETELRRPMNLQSVELRGGPRNEGLVEEIKGILGEANVFWNIE